MNQTAMDPQTPQDGSRQRSDKGYNYRISFLYLGSAISES